MVPLFTVLFPSFLLFTSPRRGERAKRKRAQGLALCAHTVSLSAVGRNREGGIRRGKKGRAKEMGVGHENEEEELLGILLGAHEWGMRCGRRGGWG